MGSCIFAVMSWIKFTSTTRVYLPSMPSTEWTNRENVSVTSGSSSCSYPYLFSPTDTGYLPLNQTCRYPHQRCRVWRQLLHWSVYPIIPRRLCHPLSPICHYPDVYCPLIVCYPVGLGIFRIQRLKVRLIEQSIIVRHALRFDVEWRGLFFCS